MDFPAGTLIAVRDGKLLMANNKWGGGGGESLKSLGAGNAGDCDGQNGCAEGQLAFMVVTHTLSCQHEGDTFRLLWLMSEICRCKTKID